MGGLSHLFDFHQSSMAKKILTHKKQDDGLEAPRNSLELQVESSQGQCTAGDVLYSFHVGEGMSGEKSYPIEASMKKLIHEEISKHSESKQNVPSIVARLMGMDMLPLDTKPVGQPNQKKNESGGKVSKKERSERGSIVHLASQSNASRQTELNSVYSCRDREADRWSIGQKYGKPRPRQHPQEEELQKFKKEFEAWQAARFRECSRVAELHTVERTLLAQESLNREKMALYGNSWRDDNNAIGPLGFTSKARTHERDSLQHHKHRKDLFVDEQKETMSLRRRTLSEDFGNSSVMDYDQNLDKSSAPTRIVILKPGPDRFCDLEETRASSLGTFEERDSIEDFLEEVKERLKCELQGKTIKRGSVRGSGIETPFSERPSNSKQIAHHIAKQVRESVTRDLGMNLMRSESTRSYRSEIQFNGPGSPEFITRDTRRFLSERLRNVLKRETHVDVPTVVSDKSRYSVVPDERIRPKQVEGALKGVNERIYWEIDKDERDVQTRSFRHGDDDALFRREPSPRNLIRSLSAPVSATSFGKLLLEDRHILTGAHIRRKHEAAEIVSMHVKRPKKEIFNFKQKVSSFRYSFTLRGRLFGKKMQSMVEQQSYEHDLIKDIMSGPTVVSSFGERHENSTEVPPSPASVCSNGQEEFWRPADYLSPISTPDVTHGEDDAVPQVFREISSNLRELRRQLNELETDRPEDTTMEQDLIEPKMVDLEDQTEAYIRDLLVASGLYDGSSDVTLSRWDPLAKPISKSVFEEVENSYRKLWMERESSMKDQNEIKVDHKVLIDLLNEILSTVFAPSMTMSRYRRKITGSFMLLPPRGVKLLESVWEIIRAYLYPPTDKSCYSLDRMVARDLGSLPWSGFIDDEINAVGREVELMIVGDLVEEIVKDLKL